MADESFIAVNELPEDLEAENEQGKQKTQPPHPPPLC